MFIIYAIIDFVSALLSFAAYAVLNVGFVVGAAFLITWSVVNYGEWLCPYYPWLDNEKVVNRTVLSTIVLSLAWTIEVLRAVGLVSAVIYALGLMVIMFVAACVAFCFGKDHRVTERH
jgi:hypothetical protein